jgi:hypothetical protein
MGETKSAGCSAAIEQDHVLPVGGIWERQSQRVVLQLSSKITYFLWAGDGRDGVSELLCSYAARSHTNCGRDGVSEFLCSYGARSRTPCGRDGVSGLFCSYPARSRTGCGQEMEETKSAGCSAAIQQDHVLSVGGRWKRRSQRVVLQPSSKITLDRWILVQGSDEGETSSGWSRDQANGLNGRKIVDTDTEVYERRQSI